MEKDVRFFENRILEMANKCYHKGIYTYSDFLDLNEQNCFNNLLSKLPPINYSLLGGNIYAERKIIVFEPKEACYQYQLPISIIKIEPLSLKFGENLNHRDYLGAILNLGIDRSKTGDILIKDKIAYLYVFDSISDYIIENLTRIRHTSVICTYYPMTDINILPEFKEIMGTVGNIRLDAVISLAFGLARSNVTKIIGEAKVFVNGKLITSNGYSLKENDLISVRGFGRIIYSEHISITKKGRNLIKILKYI